MCLKKLKTNSIIFELTIRTSPFINSFSAVQFSYLLHSLNCNVRTHFLFIVIVIYHCIISPFFATQYHIHHTAYSLQTCLSQSQLSSLLFYLNLFYPNLLLLQLQYFHRPKERNRLHMAFNCSHVRTVRTNSVPCLPLTR